MRVRQNQEPPKVEHTALQSNGKPQDWPEHTDQDKKKFTIDSSLFYQSINDNDKQESYKFKTLFFITDGNIK